MAVFMARGYKHDPFHRHVARSLANYFSPQTRAELQQAIEETPGYDGAELYELLENNTVTAWGAKSDKRQDKKRFEEMSSGDYFVIRTGQPNIVRYVQQVDFLLDETVPQELRQTLSEIIWTGPDYDLIWFSATPILELELPEEEFEEVIDDAEPGFEIADWFPSQGKNFTRIDEAVLSHFGGDEEFIDTLREWETGRRKPGTENYFLLNSTRTPADVENEHIFSFEQKSTDLADEIIAAENDGRLVIHDGEQIFATGRLGNIEGSRRDGSIYKTMLILDWQPINPVPLTSVINDRGEITSGRATLTDPTGEGTVTNIVRVDHAVWEQLRKQSSVDTSEMQDGDDQTDTETDTKTPPTVETDRTIHCADPVSPTAPYYWITHRDRTEFDEGYLQAPVDDHWQHDIAKLEPGDTIFSYYDGEIIGSATVEGVPFPIEQDGETCCKVALDSQEFADSVAFATVFEPLLAATRDIADHAPVDSSGIRDGYLCNLSTAAAEVLFEAANVMATPAQTDAERLADRLTFSTIDIDLPDKLYFHGSERSRLRRQINAALNSGKHLIFTGPPGTGKSRLARAITEQATDSDAIDGYTFTAATAEWSTFDTIGGNIPEIDSEGRERLAFDPRLFLRCFRDTDEQVQNEWLVIDELNRADIDKAFGQLFSVLSQDSVALPYERTDRVRIDWVDTDTPEAERAAIAASTDRFPVTPAWRLIATMNTFDKTSLYELSYAFMRRFSLIHVGVPSLADDGIVTRDLLDPAAGPNYATVWLSRNPELQTAIDNYHEAVAVLWHRINTYRTIGPAIVLDIFRHIAAFEGGDRTAPLSSAIVSLVYPQLEGMRETEYEALLYDLDANGTITPATGAEPTSVSLPIDMSYLRSTASDMFDIDV